VRRETAADPQALPSKINLERTVYRDKITQTGANQEPWAASRDAGSKNEPSSNQESSNIGFWEAWVLWEPSPASKALLPWALFLRWELLALSVFWSSGCDGSNVRPGEVWGLDLRGPPAPRQRKK
jgi:hypothetical protein